MSCCTINVGKYLAERLVGCNVTHFFTVPGDFTLTLLDELQSEPGLNLIGCCNELNAAYAADGYCRESGGIGCVVVTYMVGSLSALNGVAGAFSADLPLLVVAGAPNTLDEQCRHIIHHTIGELDLNQSARCYEPVVAKVLSIRHIQDVQAKIDEALFICGTLRKPVYLEISCNLIAASIAAPTPVSSLFYQPSYTSDELSLRAAVELIASKLQDTAKIVLVAGSKLCTASAVDEFAALAEALGCGVAVMPDAKGLFREEHAQHMGCYWVGVSSPHVQEIVQSADLIITAGAVLNDYTTVGWTALLPAQKIVLLDVQHSNFAGRHFPRVCLKHILAELAARAPHRPESLLSFRRYVPRTTCEAPSDITAAKEQAPDAPLSLRFLLGQLQATVASGVSAVLVETGDSWFIGQKLHLPDGVKYHVQMQYGSCGWALGACLGVGVAQCARHLQKGDQSEDSGGEFVNREATDAKEEPRSPATSPLLIESTGTRRILALIGDGSFQFTAQELTNLIRQKVNATIILLNNRTYTIEVQIHDGAYNQINNWQYAELVDIVRGDTEEASAVGLRATTHQELVEALHRAAHHRGVMLIECCIDKDDCTSHLLEWGSRVAAANMRV